MKKRILSLALIIVLVSLSVVGVVTATATGTSSKEITGKAGDTVVATLYVTENPGIIGTTITIDNFDTDALTLKKISKVENSLFTSDPVYPMEFIVGATIPWSDATALAGITYTGSILELEFMINDNAALGNYKIDVSAESISFELAPVDITLECDSITVTDGGTTPTEPQPTEPQPTEPQPTEPTPTEPTPTEPTPTEPTPTEPTPTEPTPTEPTPTEPQPTEPQPTEPQPTEPQPTEPQPTEPSTQEPTKETTDPTISPTSPTSSGGGKGPQTGDSFTVIYVSLLLISSAMVLLYSYKKRGHQQ